MSEFSSFLISAASSGSGKTTVTLGLLRALKNKNIKCQPFKCGPDYIDTKFHDIASGRKSINLDLFLSSPKHVTTLFDKYSSKADVSVIEGVMGLFDGYDKMKGSSAQIAELLDTPVILVLNAKSMAYSAAPLLYGYKNFYEDIHVAGVIFNFVGSENHYNFLKEACEDVGLTSLGYLSKKSEIEIPSRHLGLSLDDQCHFDEFSDKAASLIEKYIDIDLLLSITRKEHPEHAKDKIIYSAKKTDIAVAYDEAFNFMYHENIESLEKLGNVTFFSPLKDSILPKADFVYLPGGYPELFLRELSSNTSMLENIRDYIEKDGKLLAECGGMMYLSSLICDKEGNEYPMAGIFKQKATMQNMKLKLGYRQFNYNNCDIKGHEFHYSSIESDLDSIIQQYSAKNQPVDTQLFRYKNAIAGYTHIYWAEMDNIMEIF